MCVSWLFDVLKAGNVRDAAAVANVGRMRVRKQQQSGSGRDRAWSGSIGHVAVAQEQIYYGVNGECRVGEVKWSVKGESN